MRVQKAESGFQLSLNLFEGRLLRQCLAAIRKNYSIPPEEADSRLLATWYSSRGHENTGLSSEEILEWRQNLHQVRTDNLKLVERWLAQLETSAQVRCQLSLSAEEAPPFLAVINDHRLLTAAQQAIGEDEMGLQSLRQISRLSADKQAALYEIHLLAYLMEELLALLTE